MFLAETDPDLKLEQKVMTLTNYKLINNFFLTVLCYVTFLLLCARQQNNNYGPSCSSSNFSLALQSVNSWNRED